jgi:peptidoglycan/xylan/chitin deacetylase (PgdA/CDA1 family)
MRLFFYFLLLTTLSNEVIAQSCEQYADDLKLVKNSMRNNQKCSDKNVHLSFDDGPNTTTTPIILETLKRQNVKATFFVSTHQLEKGDLTKKKATLLDMLESGLTIASHGHDHNCHDIRYDWKGNLQPGYTDAQRREQLTTSVGLLNKFTDNKFSEQENLLLRFPYGRGISPSPKEINKMITDGRYIEGDNYSEQLDYYREHSPAMSIASESKLSHVGWNHDSKDSTTAYSAENKTEYIAAQLTSICKSSAKNIMTLFHDTRKINSTASDYDSNKTVMDEIIEKARCLGISFLAMDDFLDRDLQNGVYTKAYTLEAQMNEVIEILEGGVLKNVSPKLECPVGQTTTPKDCHSNYVGLVKHCTGNTSYCIDGQWITSLDVFQATCNAELSFEAAKELSTTYLNKSCSEAGKRQEIEKDKAVCYCQLGDAEQLKWNCFDITKESPVKFK